jgi:16S rRNA (adenine1518-N6/adenine1519-N6)-dimethyltransferase
MNSRALVSYFLGHYHVRTQTPFIVNDDVVTSIVNFLAPESDDRMLIVNPGPGPVLHQLISKCSIIAVEPEEELAYALRHELPDEVELLHQKTNMLPEANKFFANHATKDLILSLMSEHECGVALCSSGIARKLAAQPGDKDYSRSSVIAQHYASLALGPRIPPVDFLPQSKGAQQTIFMERVREKDEAFENFVTNVFRHKRKKTPLGKRPSELSPKDFGELYADA